MLYSLRATRSRRIGSQRDALQRLEAKLERRIELSSSCGSKRPEVNSAGQRWKLWEVQRELIRRVSKVPELRGTLELVSRLQRGLRWNCWEYGAESRATEGGSPVRALDTENHSLCMAVFGVLKPGSARWSTFRRCSAMIEEPFGLLCLETQADSFNLNPNDCTRLTHCLVLLPALIHSSLPCSASSSTPSLLPGHGQGQLPPTRAQGKL